MLESKEIFIEEYKKATIPEYSKSINESKYTLKEQLDRFNNFSHNEEDYKLMQQEASTL